MAKTVEKNNECIAWSDVSFTDESETGNYWMQLLIDYSKEYQYNWDSEWLEKDGEGADTVFDVSGLRSGDIIRVGEAAPDSHLYLRVADNDDEDITFKISSKTEAIQELRDGQNDIRDIVRKEIEQLDRDQLEIIHGKIKSLD